MNSEAVAQTLTIPVDKEHGGIRLVVIIVFVGTWIAGFFLVNMLLSGTGISLLSIIIAFGIAYGASAGLEAILKRRWPSGRVVQVEHDGVKLIKKGTLQKEMMSEDPVSVILWSFTVSKRARVPKGWSMLGCALEYEGEYLAVYGFLSPAQVEAFELAPNFKKLVGKRKQADVPGVRDDLRIAGEQRRLRDAEAHRWIEGAEMQADDLITYVKRIQSQFPEWMSEN